MYIKEKLYEMPLPEKYLRNGKECFYDTYRKKLIPITPEEVVRQKIAYWCEKELGTPSEMISLEQHLSHYQINSKDRADIIIHEETQEGFLVPLAIIECKAESVFLSEKAIQQCVKYADALNVNFAFITNGIEIIAYKYCEKNKKYDLLTEPPKYMQMITGDIKIVEDAVCVERPSYSSLFTEKTQQQYIDDLIIGEKTNLNYRAYAINLLEALLDGERTINRYLDCSFEIIKDLGVRLLSYGNAAGYDYFAPYRSFLIKDPKGNNQIVSIGFNAYGNGKTILCVAIDDFKKSHHALQLLFDKYMILNKGTMSFVHNGQIAIGHSGSGKAAELIKFINNKNYKLVSNDKIYLGKIDANKNIYLDSNDVSEFLFNIIEYALLRDEYRDIFKAKK